MEMIDKYQSLLQNSDFKLVILFSLLVLGSLIDFVIGVLLARFSPEIQFNSRQLKQGLIVKVATILLCFYLIPIALTFNEIGLASLYVVYTGFIFADLTSIIGHITGNTDNKEHLGVLQTIKELFNKKD